MKKQTITVYKNAVRIVNEHLKEVPQRQRYYIISIYIPNTEFLLKSDLLTVDPCKLMLDKLSMQGTFNFNSLQIFTR